MTEDRKAAAIRRGDKRALRDIKTLKRHEGGAGPHPGQSKAKQAIQRLEQHERAEMKEERRERKPFGSMVP